MPTKKKTTRLYTPSSSGPGSDTISTLQAARMCGVSVFSIQRWFDDGLLTGGTLPGGRRRIAMTSLEAFMKKHVITAAPAASGSSTRILLVDDDARLLGVMKDGLDAAGGSLVRVASSGLEAGLAMGDFKPDVLVFDMQLEDVPGSILIKRLRESSAGRSTRIVAITAKASDADAKSFLTAGANAVLHKPFGTAELLKAIGLRRIPRD